MRASSVDRQGIGLLNVLIAVGLGHQSAQNLLQELQSLRAPLLEGEVGREVGRKGRSRRKEERLALQMIFEAKRRMRYGCRPA